LTKFIVNFVKSDYCTNLFGMQYKKVNYAIFYAVHAILFDVNVIFYASK